MDSNIKVPKYFHHTNCTCVSGEIKFNAKVLKIKDKEISIQYQYFEENGEKISGRSNSYIAVKTTMPIDYSSFLELLKNSMLSYCCDFDKWLTKAIKKIKKSSKDNKEEGNKLINKKTKITEYEDKKGVTINVYSCTHHSCYGGSLVAQDLIFTYNSILYHFNHSDCENRRGNTDNSSFVNEINLVEDVTNKLF